MVSPDQFLPSRQLAREVSLAANHHGAHTLTATSGPGISLYSENIGLAIMGEVPLVGFFAGGEIARHHLYGYTGVLTVFTRQRA